MEEKKFNYDMEQSFTVLERTPTVLQTLLVGLDDFWIHNNEGGDTWSPFDVVGHLLHGEKTDWLQRMKKIVLEEDKKFKPFDRFAQFEESKGKTLQQILDEFALARKQNLDEVRKMNLTSEDLKRTGIHPVFGEVTLHQLMSCWAAHDLNHLAQISRVMAKQYKDDVGPWVEFLRVMK